MPKGASWLCSVSDPCLTSTLASISQAPEGTKWGRMDVDGPFPSFLGVQLHRQLGSQGTAKSGELQILLPRGSSIPSFCPHFLFWLLVLGRKQE